MDENNRNIYETENNTQDSNNQNPYNQNPYGQNPYGQTPYNQNMYNQYNQDDYPQNTSNAKGNISMVLGILSMVICCCYYLAIPLGIAAIIFGIVSLKQKEPQKGFAIAGIVTGIIAFLLVIVLFFMALLVYESGAYDQFMLEFNRELERQQQIQQQMR